MDQNQQLTKQNHQSNHSDCQSLQSNILQYEAIQISFPQLPQQYDTIYDIYIQGQQKMHKLRSKVEQLQRQILQMQRARDDSKSLQDEGVILLQEDIQEDNQFIANYQKQCNKREQELKSLDDIYIKLKRIYTEESILNNKQLKQNIIKHIEINREVIQYKVTHQYIIMLYKYIKYQTSEHQKICSYNQLNIQPFHQLNLQSVLNSITKSSSHSNRKTHKSQDFRQEKIKISSFGIKIINFQNMFNKFIHKSTQENEFNEENMMKVKQKAEKQVNAAVNIDINSKNQFQSISYNIEKEDFYVLDNKNKIYSIKNDGIFNPLNISIDQHQKVKLFQSINDRLWIGSNKGVLRQYIIEQNKLTINKLYGCFDKQKPNKQKAQKQKAQKQKLQQQKPQQQKPQIDAYILINYNNLHKILFNKGKNLYQINLNTYEITETSKLSTKILYSINDYIVTQDKIYRVVIKESKNVLNIDKIYVNDMQSLTLWYKQQKYQQKKQKQIVHINLLQTKGVGVPDTKQIKTDKFYIILADKYGNFFQIFT